MPSLKRNGSHLLKNAGGHLIHTCGADLVSDCCSDRGGVPDVLTLTVTRSECAAISVGQTCTLNWNSGSSQWTGTMNCSGGGTISWVFYCNGACAGDSDCDGLAMELEWGEPTSAQDDEDGDFTCDPFFWEATEAGGGGLLVGGNACNSGCLDPGNDYLDVTITE